LCHHITFVRYTGRGSDAPFSRTPAFVAHLLLLLRRRLHCGQHAQLHCLTCQKGLLVAPLSLGSVHLVPRVTQHLTALLNTCVPLPPTSLAAPSSTAHRALTNLHDTTASPPTTASRCYRYLDAHLALTSTRAARARTATAGAPLTAPAAVQHTPAHLTAPAPHHTDARRRHLPPHTAPAALSCPTYAPLAPCATCVTGRLPFTAVCTYLPHAL